MKKRLLWTLPLLCILLCLLPGLAAADETAETPLLEWEISKSKTATNLDENFESQITLSLPSAEETLVSDVVFVLDKSTSADLEEQALSMLLDLKAQIEQTNAQVKVGVVIFNKVAHITDFLDLATQYEEIESAITQTISSGTNTHAGLLAGKALLDSDTSVAAHRKYLIFVSDGITYMYNEEPTVTSWSFQGDSVLNWAGPDNWNSKYGTNDPPENWDAWLEEIEGQVVSQGTTYEYPYGGTASASTPVEKASEYANSVDKALYLTNQVYQEAKRAGYHCYALTAGTSSALQYLWGPSFMSHLSQGENVNFSTIQNDIYYLLDSGSSVMDKMGKGKWNGIEYNFDLVNMESMFIKEGEQVLPIEQVGENTYGFGQEKDGTYRYTLEYYPEQENTEEYFIWYIHVPISNFCPVQLTYTVKLTNPQETAGTYGNYDADGSQELDGLYTNNLAELYPVDSNGNEGTSELFGKPSVSYTVTPAPSPTESPTPTETPISTQTPSYSASPDETQSPPATPVPTETPSATQTPPCTTSPDETHSPTATPSATQTPPCTASPDETQSPPATPVPTETPEETPLPPTTPIPTETAPPQVPQTGDSNIATWVLTLLISLCCCIWLICRKKTA